MSEVTRILSKLETGDANAASELLPLVYDELRQLASSRMMVESPEQTLQATALVHEAYLRLVGSDGGQSWDSRGHFFAAAAEAMRRILVDRARNRRRLKRGGDRTRVDIDSVSVATDAPDDELLQIDEAIQRLASEYPDCAELIRLRFFAGLSHSEAAAALGIPRRTADRQWAFARAWLKKQLAEDQG